MIEISISEELKSCCPNFKGAAVLAEISNTKHDEALWEEIEKLSAEIKSTLEIADIRHDINIAATREAYKTFGKDPNRYRPSAEALKRRILRDLPLYQIDTAVDLINLVSIKTGYSIGGFDFDKIEGTSLELGVGKANEKFEAIGRGLLNIEGLPVYRDEIGGIGTPTSDEERTKLSLATKKVLILINGYSGENGLKEASDYTIQLLEKHIEGKILSRFIYF